MTVAVKTKREDLVRVKTSESEYERERATKREREEEHTASTGQGTHKRMKPDQTRKRKRPTLNDTQDTQNLFKMKQAKLSLKQGVKRKYEDTKETNQIVKLFKSRTDSDRRCDPPWPPPIREDPLSKDPPPQSRGN